MYDGMCWIDGCGPAAEADHVLPLQPRPGDPQGSDSIENLRPISRRCNGSKSNQRLTVGNTWGIPYQRVVLNPDGSCASFSWRWAL